MNDNEIDRRLREHGTAWREDNHDRPGIDWEAVTVPNRTRTWIAVAGVTVAAAAIIVPLVVTAGGRSSSAPAPGTHPTPSPSTTHYSNGNGVAVNFFALTPQRVDVVYFPSAVGPQTWVSTSEGGGTPRALAIRSLAWSPDSRDIAYLTARACAFLSHSSPVCGDDPLAGTRILDTSPPGRNLETSALLLPAFGTRDGYGPVFWWRGQLVTSFNGSLRLLNGHGGLGKVVATGVPKEVDSISSDPTGNHLLISSAGTTYRWDSGKLSVVAGVWTQPGW